MTVTAVCFCQARADPNNASWPARKRLSFGYVPTCTLLFLTPPAARHNEVRLPQWHSVPTTDGSMHPPRSFLLEPLP